MPPTRWPRSPRRARSASGSRMRSTRSPASKGSSGGWRRSARRRGVTVIDDFAHNPDKIDATLATLRAQPGRLLIMFQPHGYGPLAKMGEQLADSFADGHGAGRPAVPARPGLSGRDGRQDAAAATGSPSRSASAAARPSIFRERARSATRCSRRRKPGDRILIMGARDDTLIDFARELGRAAWRHRNCQISPALTCDGAAVSMTPGTRNRHRLEAAASRARAAAPALPAEI